MVVSIREGLFMFLLMAQFLLSSEVHISHDPDCKQAHYSFPALTAINVDPSRAVDVLFCSDDEASLQNRANQAVNY